MKVCLRFKSIVHSDTKIHLSKSLLKGRARSFRMGVLGDVLILNHVSGLVYAGIRGWLR